MFLVLDRSQAVPVWAGLFYAWQLHVEVGKFFSEPIKTQPEKTTFFWFWTGLRQSQYGTFYFPVETNLMASVK